MSVSLESLADNNQVKKDAKHVHPKKWDFANSFAPIYYFSRVTGLLPFTIARNSNGEIQMPSVSRLDRLWFVVSICLHLSLICILLPSFNELKKVLTRQQFILIYCDQLRLVLSLIFGALTIAMDMCNRFKLVALLKKITIFDKEVRKICTTFNFFEFFML